jgi:organic radical activating enzyme
MDQGYVSEIFTSFQGEGARVGEHHLFVRLAGCNLRCSYCDTPDSLERTASCTVYGRDGSRSALANPMTAASLAGLLGEVLKKSAAVDVVAITGGEPLMQAAFLRNVLSTAQLHRPVLLETNGVLPKQLEQLIELVDIISMDVKLPSNTGEAAFWDEHRRFLDIARRKEVYVKILVDEQTKLSEAHRAGAILHSEVPGITVFLQPITGADGRVSVSQERLWQTYSALRAYVGAVRVIPQTHKMLGIQ